MSTIVKFSMPCCTNIVGQLVTLLNYSTQGYFLSYIDLAKLIKNFKNGIIRRKYIGFNLSPTPLDFVCGSVGFRCDDWYQFLI